MNTLHLNSVRLNGIGEVQSVSLSAGADPEQPPVEPSKYIQFADSAVEAICVANWSSDGIGLTMEDAAAVTSLGTVFYNNKDIVSFDELQYFTGLTKLYGDSSLGVFYNCSNLKSVKIPASVTEIGLRTFANCNALTDVGSLENVEIIGDIAFANTNALAIVLNMPKLREIQGKNNFTYSGITGIESLGSVVNIPDGTAYNNGVFAYCSALAYANLNESTTYIGAHTFRGCTSLSQLNIPTSVTTIGAAAFAGDLLLEYDYLNLENLESIGTDALNGVKVRKLNLGKVPTLPTASSSSVQNYGDKSVLEEITISGNVTSIPTYSFIRYTALKKCEDMSNVTYIGLLGMSQTSITEQSLPNVETIDKNAFQNCTELRLVDIGDTCTAINQQAFKGCTALETLIVRATTPPTAGAEILILTTCPIYVPDASLEAYKTATNWSNYADRIHPLSEIEGSPYIQFEDPVTEAICIANWSSDGIGLTKEDAANVTSIAGKFTGNTEIVSFDELDYFTGLTNIDTSSFYNCSNMKSLRLPKNITTVRPYAFNNCTAAFEIDLPNLTMASSGNGREFAPSGVVAVKNMGSIPKVPVFSSCKSLRYAILPVTATSVAASAFYQCTALEALVFKNPTPATIGDNYAFTGTSCNVYVPDASVADYQAATRWTSISSRIKGISSLATDNPTLYEEIKDYLL